MRLPSRKFAAYWAERGRLLSGYPIKKIAGDAFAVGYLAGVAAGKVQAVNAAVRLVAKRKMERKLRK